VLLDDASSAAAGPDAGVIDDARRRQRRHRAAAAVAILLAAALLTSALWSRVHAGRRYLAFSDSSPTVDARAFRNEGDLAFISRGALWVLDGSGALRRIALQRGAVPAAPLFSSDGRWLAFLGTAGDDSIAPWRSSPRLWIAHADGTDPQEIGWLRDPTVIGWSPRSEDLAVSDERPDGRRAAVWLLTPQGRRRRLMSAAEVDGGAWSPDGSELAVASDSRVAEAGRPFTASLTVYPIAGERPTVWLDKRSTSPTLWPPVARIAHGAPYHRTVFLPAGWWPAWGIGFWTDSADGNDPSVRDGGGLALWHLSARRGRPRLLGTTLSDRALSPITASAGGQLAITDEPGRSGAEPLWQNEVVERCSPASQQCRPVVAPPGSVSLDPAWAPDGSSLVYLVGRNLGNAGNAGFAQPAVARFYDTLQLWRYDPATRSSTSAAAAQGAVVPVWSHSSTGLLFVADDGLWLWRPEAAEPVEIAGPLFSPSSWHAFFAQIDWSDQFAWSR
jgi:dipeptidyl aminopeptidase/acylaminoacyl peptidase